MKRRDYVKAFSPVCHALRPSLGVLIYPPPECSRWTSGGPPSCGDTVPQAASR